MNLIIRRALRNYPIRERYGVDEAEVLASTEEQESLFYRMFPDKVDAGSKKPEAFDWMLSRTRDGTGQTAPRELIHLLESVRASQLSKLEIGDEQPGDEKLFTAAALKGALGEVSKVRLQQTLFAEYPALKPAIQDMEGRKTQQNLTTLAAIWRCSDEQAREMASKLVEVGFFEKRGTPAEPTYWVPFLYRESLNLIQGSAD